MYVEIDQTGEKLLGHILIIEDLASSQQTKLDKALSEVLPPG